MASPNYFIMQMSLRDISCIEMQSIQDSLQYVEVFLCCLSFSLHCRMFCSGVAVSGLGWLTSKMPCCLQLETNSGPGCTLRATLKERGEKKGASVYVASVSHGNWGLRESIGRSSIIVHSYLILDLTQKSCCQSAGCQCVATLKCYLTVFQMAL